ncbi:hypothetical protein D4764_05G0001060, partial [Takifugu flavidus]
ATPPPPSHQCSLPTSTHLPLGQTTSSGCLVAAKHRSPTVASNAAQERREFDGQTADERRLIVLIGSSRPCSACLGLGEVKRCYCSEVSNPTRNKEDGRNAQRSPISAP